MAHKLKKREVCRQESVLQQKLCIKKDGCHLISKKCKARKNFTNTRTYKGLIIWRSNRANHDEIEHNLKFLLGHKFRR